jgi:hypothetical protein
MDGRHRSPSRAAGQNPAYRPSSLAHAPVAQRIEHRITDPGVGGSNPSGGTQHPPPGRNRVADFGTWRSRERAGLGDRRPPVRTWSSRLIWVWRSLVARRVRDAEAAGSSPATQTTLLVTIGGPAAGEPPLAAPGMDRQHRAVAQEVARPPWEREDAGSSPAGPTQHHLGDASRWAPAAVPKTVGGHSRGRSTRPVSATRR